MKELELTREDLINGTNKLAIYKLEKELERLTYLRRDANVFKKMMYNSKIKKLEKELYALKDKDKDKKIVVSTESTEISNNEEELREDSLDNVVGGVPYEVGKDMAQSTIENDNYDDSYNSYEADEKRKTR